MAIRSASSSSPTAATRTFSFTHAVIQRPMLFIKSMRVMDMIHADHPRDFDRPQRPWRNEFGWPCALFGA